MDLVLFAFAFAAIALIAGVWKIAFHKGIDTEFKLLQIREANKQAKTLYFCERLRMLFPNHVGELDSTKGELLLDKWKEAHKNVDWAYFERPINGVKYGKPVLFGGYKSSVDEYRALSQVLKQFGGFISEGFTEFILKETVINYYKILDAVEASEKN